MRGTVPFEIPVPSVQEEIGVAGDRARRKVEWRACSSSKLERCLQNVFIFEVKQFLAMSEPFSHASISDPDQFSFHDRTHSQGGDLQ